MSPRPLPVVAPPDRTPQEHANALSTADPVFSRRHVASTPVRQRCVQTGNWSDLGAWSLLDRDAGLPSITASSDVTVPRGRWHSKVYGRPSAASGDGASATCRCRCGASDWPEFPNLPITCPFVTV